MKCCRNFVPMLMAFIIGFILPDVSMGGIMGNYDLKVFPSSPTGYETIYGKKANYYLDYDVSINGSKNMEAFCVEGADASKLTQQYTFLSIDKSLKDFGLNPAIYGTAAWIAEKYYNQSEDWKAAAQVAIWEVVFDDLTRNLDVGNLIADTYKQEAQSILDTLPTTLPDFSNNWVLAVNPTVGSDGTVGQKEYQNYLVRVPEPATMLLLGFGLLGIVFFRRQRIFK